MARSILIFWALCGIAGGAGAATPHFVFAHYMVCLPSYGETLAGFKHEIQAAQAAGIDGFALNEGTWTEDYYARRTATIFEAARQLGTGFKLFFSVDFGSGSNDVRAVNVIKDELVKKYGRHPNYFQYQGKIVLSSYMTHGLPWRRGIIEPLRREGYDIFFVPFFEAAGFESWPNSNQVAAVCAANADLVDGLFYFGASGLTGQLVKANQAFAGAVKAAGKLSMGSFSPGYWGMKQYSLLRRYYEADGGEGIEARWRALIEAQPDWVEICTWNDMDEGTYVTPVERPAVYDRELESPNRWTHKGYLEMSKHYIAWYKTGEEPPITRDELFYFYRTHSKDAVPADKSDVMCKWWEGTYADTLYTTVFLTAPAQLEVVSGAGGSTNSLPAGRSHVRTAFLPGHQKMTLRRNGQEVLAVTGPDIQPRIARQDLFPATGYAYAP
jgi:hypothetical protein